MLTTAFPASSLKASFLLRTPGRDMTAEQADFRVALDEQFGDYFHGQFKLPLPEFEYEWMDHLEIGNGESEFEKVNEYLDPVKGPELMEWINWYFGCCVNITNSRIVYQDFIDDCIKENNGLALGYFWAGLNTFDLEPDVSRELLIAAEFANLPIFLACVSNYLYAPHNDEPVHVPYQMVVQSVAKNPHHEVRQFVEKYLVMASDIDVTHYLSQT